jgi:hypothetical protein
MAPGKNALQGSAAGRFPLLARLPFLRRLFLRAVLEGCS